MKKIAVSLLLCLLLPLPLPCFLSSCINGDTAKGTVNNFLPPFA